MSKRRIRLANKSVIVVSEPTEGERTHWEDCWRVHPMCRMVLAADLLTKAQETLYVLKEIVKEMDVELRGKRK